MVENCATSSAWVACQDINCLIDWLDHWQTMLTGIGAIVAASVSIIYLHKQIRADSMLEDGRRKRRLAAARARLQLALSDATHYANEAIMLLRARLDAVAGTALAPPVHASQPPLPQAALQAFETMIEATDDEQFSALIADAVSQIQVMDSRLGDLINNDVGLDVFNIHAYILNAARIHAFCSTTFPYSRREEEIPPREMNWDLLKSALRLNGLFEHDYQDLHEFVHRAAERAAQANAGAQPAGNPVAEPFLGSISG